MMTLDEQRSLFQTFVRRHQLAVEELTENQLADALRQAMPDFKRNVARDGAQQVIYLPGAEAHYWREKYRDAVEGPGRRTCVCGFCDGEDCA